MAEYNKVMTQIKPDLPKVIDTEQIYVYVPKASYDQAGIMKPDKTQFVIAGDYTLTIKHFEMTDDHVAVDVKMGYKNDTALNSLADKDFVTKGNMTGYAVPKLTNNDKIDKAYIESGSNRGTSLLEVSASVTSGTIAQRDGKGQLRAETESDPSDDVLINAGHVSLRYVKKTGVVNEVYATDSAGADSSIPFSKNPIPYTIAHRTSDGSLRGIVTDPEKTTLLNYEYVSGHYIPVGDDGKIPNSYLPADIGADEIVSGYYITGEFWDNFDGWEQENTWQINENPMTIFYNETETPMPYFKSYGSATIRALSADNVLSGTVESTKMFQWMDDSQRLRFAKKNDEIAGVAYDVGQGTWSYKVSNDTTYQATDASVKQALRTIVFSRRPDDSTFLEWLKENAIQTAGPTPIAGDYDKLYVDLNTNKTYRWDVYAGYVQIGSSLALGTTHDSAYYGDFGDKAYKHSQAVGNPHNTQITDITGLKTKLDTIDNKMNPVASNALSSYVLLSASNSTKGVMTIAFPEDFTKININGTDYAVPDDSIAISTGQVITVYVKAGLTPYCGTIPLTSTITLPCAWLQIWASGTATTGDATPYAITIGQPASVTPLNILCSVSRTPFTIPIRNKNRNLVTNVPVDQYDCINLGYWQTNYKPFNYTTISTLSAVEHGFNVEYQIDGKSAEIEIPLEGTDDIIVDIDETNKMINIHLDAKVRAKLAKMLTLPAEAPAKNSIVGVGTNNAQMIMTEQEARDAISVFKTVTISQTDYDNLAVKDNKTLYLITG